jgi:hypothetical protein
MVLEKTLENLRKTKESFFNLEKGLYVNHSIAKNELKCSCIKLRYHKLFYRLIRKNFIKKTGVNSTEIYKYETYIQNIGLTYFDNKIEGVKLLTFDHRLKLV